jgi:hypothetical protein
MRKSKKRVLRRAAKAPNWVRHVAASKSLGKRANQKHQKALLGTFGPASPGRSLSAEEIEAWKGQADAGAGPSNPATLGAWRRS